MSEPDNAPSAGDILWIEFSPTEGAEQAGRRPALVLSDRPFNSVVGRALVMPITRRIRGWPFEIALPAGTGVAGAVLADQVRIVDLRHAQPAGSAPAAVLEEARAKLAALAGIA